MADGRFYLTTPIYYVNADPHIGHAYTTIMADIIARHHRQLGEDVFFLTGTDEHGGKIAALGRARGAHAARARRHAVGALPRPRRRARRHLRLLHPHHRPRARGGGAAHLPARSTTRATSTRAATAAGTARRREAFYAESDLLEGRLCPVHRTPVEWVEEENWFFRLSAYRDRLLAHYDANPGWVQPQARYNEARRMIELGLEDLSVSRAQVEWGVPVPWDPGQTIYVWIDALLNYRTALGYARPGEDLVERFWPPDLQLMAKDILKFHAVIWPAMLMAAGLELPRRLMIHGYVLKGGEKMSKTTGNVVDPFPFIERVRHRRAALLPGARGALRRGRHVHRRGLRGALLAASSPTSSATCSTASSA